MAALDLERRWESLRGKILAHADSLIRRGTLTTKQARGRRVWVIRLAERSANQLVHSSIYIGGDPELVRRAKDLLQRCRARQHWPREIAADLRLAADAHGLLRRLLGRRCRRKRDRPVRTEEHGEARTSL